MTKDEQQQNLKLNSQNTFFCIILIRDLILQKKLVFKKIIINIWDYIKLEYFLINLHLQLAYALTKF